MRELVSIRAGSFRAEFLPEVLKKLPLVKVRKLFRLISSEPFQNREAMEALEAYLAAVAVTMDLDWKETSRAYAAGWKDLDFGKRAERWTPKQLTAARQENKRLETQLKQAKRCKERWEKVRLEWQDITKKI